MKKTAVVNQIRSAHGERVKHLRDIALLTSIGLIDFIPISLYQLGVIKHLPDPPGKIFHSDKVNASKDAQVLGLPDGTVSLLLYAANLVLTGAALKQEKKGSIFRYLIGANAVGQALGGAYYLFNMAKVQKKICLYCVTGALVNFAVLFPLKRLFTS